MDRKTFENEIMTKEFCDVLEMIKSMPFYGSYEKRVKGGANEEETDDMLKALSMLFVMGDEEKRLTLDVVSTKMLYEKANKVLRREILGNKKKKVAKEDVKNMIIDCCKAFHNYDKMSDFVDDMLGRLQKM